MTANGHLPEPDETGNGISPAEWRAWVVREMRAGRAEFQVFRRDEFAPVRDIVLRNQGRDNFIGAAVRWFGPSGVVVVLVGFAKWQGLM